MTRKINPPNLMHGLTEGTRATYEFLTSSAFSTLPSMLFRQADQEGMPTLTIQGFMMHDLTTWNMRQFLSSNGHHPYDADIGLNFGITGGAFNRLEGRLQKISDENEGRKCAIVGHSLGGIQGLLLAYRYPDLVGKLITKGSPFGAARMEGGTNRIVYGAYEIINPDDDALVAELNEYMEGGPPEATVTSLYSLTDGVIAPDGAVNPWGEQGIERTENIEINSSHVGMMHNREVWAILHDRLSAPDENWRPFYEPDEPEAETVLDGALVHG